MSRLVSMTRRASWRRRCAVVGLSLACLGLAMAAGAAPVQASASATPASSPASAPHQAPTVAAAWPYDRALDDQLDLLLRQGFDRPEPALRRVRELQNERRHAAQLLPLRLTEGRLLVLAGEFGPAQALAEELARRPEARDAGLLLQAEWADRQGQGERATA